MAKRAHEWSEWEELHSSMEMRTLVEKSNTILQNELGRRGNPKKGPGAWCLLGTTPLESARVPGFHPSHMIRRTLITQNFRTGMAGTEVHIFAKKTHVNKHFTLNWHDYFRNQQALAGHQFVS